MRMVACLQISLPAGLARLTVALVALVAVVLEPCSADREGERERVCSLITIYGLKTAECMGFNLSGVPGDLDSDLKTFNLQKNQIASLSDHAFQNYSSLQNLYLVSNRIRRIDDKAFQNLRNLQILDLESNQLDAIPKYAFRPLMYLRILSFNNNPITRIEADDLLFLTQVETLKFENCRLERIDPGAFRPLSRLYELNIANNQLKHLDHQLAYSFDSLTVLRLYNNVWHCDCRLRWLRVSVQAIPNWDFGPNSPICEAPDLLRGVNWKHLSPEKFACPSVIYSLDNHQNASNVEISWGSNASIDCVAWGDPEPSIVWMKNGMAVDPRFTSQHSFYASSVRNSQDKNVRGVLNIVNARKSDEGSYKCVAENSAGRSEVTYKVWMVEKRAVGSGPDDRRGARIVLTYEVILGVILGCVLLLGSLLVCLVCVVSRRQRARKIVKRRKSNKKHRQLLVTDKHVNFKGESKSSSSCDQLIGNNFEFDSEKVNCQMAEARADDKIPYQNKDESAIVNQLDSTKVEREISSSNRKSFFSSKKSDKKKAGASGRPDILSNESANNGAGAIRSRSVFSRRDGAESKRIDDSHRAQSKPDGRAKVTQFSTSMNSSSPSNNHCNNPVCNKPAVKSLDGVKSESESQHKSKIPNSDRVPLKKILKTPSASFDKNIREDSPTTSSSGTGRVVVKSNRPPDIYATLPVRSKMADQANKPQPPKLTGRNMAADGADFEREIVRLGEATAEFQQLQSTTPAHNIEHLLIFDQPNASNSPSSSSSSTIPAPFHTSQSRYPVGVVSVRSSFHQDAPPTYSSPSCNKSQMRDNSSNMAATVSKRHRSSTTDVRVAGAGTTIVPAAANVPTGADPYRNPGSRSALCKGQEVSSSTSLHEILTPPFKKSPVVYQKQNPRPPVARKKGEYGTAV